MSDTEKEQRIRERAYLLWKAEGEPDGQSDDHWARAVAMEAAPAAASEPEPLKPSKTGVSKAKSAAAAKPKATAPSVAATAPKAGRSAKVSMSAKK